MQASKLAKKKHCERIYRKHGPKPSHGPGIQPDGGKLYSSKHMQSDLHASLRVIASKFELPILSKIIFFECSVQTIRSKL